MKTRIQKWGNSLGVRLPKHIAEEKSLHERLGVSVVLKNDQIVIGPNEADLSLKHLPSQVSPKNLHSESEWFDSSGDELW